MTTAKARKFQELREARGLSVDEVSRRMGVPASSIRRWENGEEDPDEGSLNQLAEALGASQDALRHERDERHHGSG
jgi:transcriptional regulator with XRE-family HTH domain